MPTSRNRKKKKKPNSPKGKKTPQNNSGIQNPSTNYNNGYISRELFDDDASFEEFKNMISNIEKKGGKAKNTFETYSSDYSTADIFNYLTGIQLLHENHGKNLRIEMMATIALKNLNFKIAAPIATLKKTMAESYPSSSMEDPPEGLFTESVLFHGGNYIVMPGIATRSCDIFRAMSESIFLFPNKIDEKVKDEIMQGTTLMLELGDQMFRKGKLEVNMFVDSETKKLLLPETIEEYSLSEIEFAALCDKCKISEQVVSGLFLDPKDPRLAEQDYDLNPMLYHPLVRVEKRIYFPLISAQMLAINEFILRTILKSGNKKSFLGGYNDLIYNDVMMSCKYMGWRLTDIKLPELAEEYGIKEAILYFDRNKLCYLVFRKVTDFQDKYDEAKQADQLYDQKKNKFGYQERVNKVLDFFNTEKRFEDQEIFVLYVMTDIGRTSYSLFEKPKYGGETTWLAAFNLILLAITENWNALSLFKYAKVYRKFTDTTELMSLDPIDSYSTYKSKDDSFYFSDDRRPDFITIVPGTGADVYREAKLKRDLKGRLTVYDKQIGYELVERFREYSSIYELAHVDRSTTLMVDSFDFPVWIIGKSTSADEVPFYKMVVEAIAVWLDKLSGALKGFLAIYKLPLLTLNISLDGQFFNQYTLKEINTNVFDDNFEFASPSTATIDFKIPASILKELQGADNRGERKIMLKLLEAVNLLFPQAIEVGILLNILDEIVPLGRGKMILLLNSESDFRFDPRWLMKKHLITSAEINMLLDELTEIIKYPNVIQKKIGTKDEKSAFCNHIVSSLLNYLLGQANNFSNEDILRFLFEINESLIHSNAQEMVRIPAQVYCFGDKDERVEKLMADEIQSVKTSISIRCLIEYLAASPVTGKKLTGYDDADRLLAIMNEIINFGMVSDAIRFDLDNPEIGLLESGRIGVSKSFFDDKLKPFAKANTLADVENYMENFTEMFDTWEPEPEATESNHQAQWEKIDEAFQIDWGVPLSEILGFIRLLVTYGVQKETSVVVIRKVDFKAYLLNNQDLLSKEKIERLLELLSLKPREKFLTAPEGYKNDDVFPWKYNREFSLIRRPIVEYLDNDGFEMLIWGVRSADVAQRQINQLFWNGRLKYGKEKILQLLGDRNKDLGDRFRQQAYHWFNLHENLKAYEYEVKIDINGHLKADKNYGDIDILVFDRDKKTVFNVECKRTHQAKNIHEMKTELDSYMGRDGQKKKIQKHVDRHNWLVQNQALLCAFLKTDTPVKMVSFLLTSEVVPVKYIVGVNSPLPLLSFAELKSRGLESIYGLDLTSGLIS